MREYVKIYCCADCVNYNFKKHKCNYGAKEEGKAQDHFYRDCPLGINKEDDKEISPSAQPEIIRCKDCKHRPTATRAAEGITYGFSVEFPDKKCPFQCEDGWYNHYPDDDFYCGCAERRDYQREN